MLTAMCFGERVFARDMTIREKPYYCPFCDGEMVLVKPEADIIDHFRHLSNDCEYRGEPETNEHLMGKQYLCDYYSNLPFHLDNPKVSVEAKLSNGRIADVLLENFNQLEIKRIAIEFQCSPISLKEFRERNMDYRRLNLPVLWIFGTKKYYNIRIDKYSKHISLRDVEVEASELYGGYVLYLNTDLINQPFFSPLVAIRYYDDYGRKRIPREIIEIGKGFFSRITRRVKEGDSIINLAKSWREIKQSTVLIEHVNKMNDYNNIKKQKEVIRK